MLKDHVLWQYTESFDKYMSEALIPTWVCNCFENKVSENGILKSMPIHGDLLVPPDVNTPCIKITRVAAFH